MVSIIVSSAVSVVTGNSSLVVPIPSSLFEDPPLHFSRGVWARSKAAIYSTTPEALDGFELGRSSLHVPRGIHLQGLTGRSVVGPVLGVGSVSHGTSQ